MVQNGKGGDTMEVGWAARRCGMTHVGEPKRTVIVEPLIDPVPREVPHEAEKPAQPVQKPEERPVDTPPGRPS